MKICAVTDIAEGHAKGFHLPFGQVFAVKHQGEIFLYLNECPHFGVNLDWQQDKFFNYDGSFLQCSLHGALFEIDTGHCIAGPCRGQGLQRLNYEIVDGEIMLAEGT